ncbi:MAG: GxxExxY protein [Sporocytophaga sp.]|nr:GxxExxY protein [Sporocytophaga sp.]
MKYSELTGRIIGCAMEVHKSLGNGFQEVIYQRALGIEFDFKKLLYVREEEKPVFYRDIPIGSRRVDFIVEDNILIELKAISKLEDVHLAQAINYMEAFKMEICLLINFGSRSMEFRRLENKKLLR